MGASRALGVLLCVVCAVVIVAEIYFGLYLTWVERAAPLAISIPVVLGVVVVAGLGLWLGWIMATTKEVAPPPAATETPEEKRE